MTVEYQDGMAKEIKKTIHILLSEIIDKVEEGDDSGILSHILVVQELLAIVPKKG
jgi:hypothetical protein